MLATGTFPRDKAAGGCRGAACTGNGYVVLSVRVVCIARPKAIHGCVINDDPLRCSYVSFTPAHFLSISTHDRKLRTAGNRESIAAGRPPGNGSWRCQPPACTDTHLGDTTPRNRCSEAAPYPPSSRHMDQPESSTLVNRAHAADGRP